MSLLKKVGGMFFEGIEEDKPTATPGAPKPIVSVSLAPAGGAAPTGPVLNPDMVKALQDVVTRRATPFTTLEQRAAALAEVVPDETQRVKAAFTLLKQEGRTGQQIIQAIDTHVMDLDGEQRRFVQSSEAAVKAKSGKLRADVTALQQDNDNDTKTIADLQQKITDLTARIQERAVQIHDKSAEADSAEAEIQRTVAEFATAVDAVKATLANRKNVLATILA